jgi:hypothetical protein
VFLVFGIACCHALAGKPHAAPRPWKPPSPPRPPPLRLIGSCRVDGGVQGCAQTGHHRPGCTLQPKLVLQKVLSYCEMRAGLSLQVDRGGQISGLGPPWPGLTSMAVSKPIASSEPKPIAFLPDSAQLWGALWPTSVACLQKPGVGRTGQGPAHKA